MEQRTDNHRSFGRAGEEEALSYLIRQKFRILKRNYRVGRWGEIDIIAREGEYICFIEVKTRSSLSFGTPSEAVTRKKQDTIRRLAWVYLKQNGLTAENVRFDVVEVMAKNKGLPLDRVSIHLIRNAF